MTDLAPLKDDLAPERRALAEDLRKLFASLGVGVRRYAVRRHLDASSVTRYLNGTRVPPWAFVAGLVADIAEAGDTPVTLAAERGLRELHRAALRTHGRAHQVQVLQDRLVEADEETRRIRTQERALAEVLRDRQRQLSQTQRRVRELEEKLDGHHRSRQAELAVWRGEYEKLKAERDELQEEVGRLQEALTVAAAELIAAEEQCRNLENRLESAQGQEEGGGSSLSLMEVLETTDRDATVPELVALVSSLETSTRRGMASELVTSASRSRAVADVAALLAALYGASLQRYAEAALPAIVMMRPVQDAAALVTELSVAGLGDPVVTLLQTAVKVHNPADVASLAKELHLLGMHEQAKALVSAAAVTRPVPDVLDLTEALVRTGLDTVALVSMAPVARRRPVPDIVALIRSLHRKGLHELVEALETSTAAERPATDVAELMGALFDNGLEPDAHVVFWGTQHRTTGHLIALISALHTAEMHKARMRPAAATLLTQAMAVRPVEDLGRLVADLHVAGRHQYSSDAVVMALHSLPQEDFARLVTCLNDICPEDDGWADQPDAHSIEAGWTELHSTYRPGAARAVLDTAARTCRAQDAAALLLALRACSQHDLADVVFRRTTRARTTGHAGAFLDELNRLQAPGAFGSHLADQARRGGVTVTALLALALDAAGLGSHLDGLLAGSGITSPTDMVALLQYLPVVEGAGRRAQAIACRVLHHTVRASQLEQHVDLALALEAVSLTAHARTLEAIIATRDQEHARAFSQAVQKARRRRNPKFWHAAFWKKMGNQSRASHRRRA